MKCEITKSFPSTSLSLSLCLLFVCVKSNTEIHSFFYFGQFWVISCSNINQTKSQRWAVRWADAAEEKRRERRERGGSVKLLAMWFIRFVCYLLNAFNCSAYGGDMRAVGGKGDSAVSAVNWYTATVCVCVCVCICVCGCSFSTPTGSIVLATVEVNGATFAFWFNASLRTHVQRKWVARTATKATATTTTACAISLYQLSEQPVAGTVATRCMPQTGARNLMSI